MHVIPNECLTQIGDEFVTEASDAGLEVGQWPEFVRARDVLWMRVGADRANGELQAVLYQNEAGVKLAIFND